MLPCPRKITGEAKRHFWLMYNFDKLGRQFDPEGVVIESMEHWAGSETSDASTNSGALFKVDRLSGGYGGVCAVRGTPYNFVTAKEWKGQLTKEATRLRVLRAIPGTVLKDEHSTDAIGIGLALGGEL